MYKHEPKEYLCPFCHFLAGNEDKYNNTEDIVYQTKLATAFVSPKWWINNPGHVLVVPNGHYENIYNIPDEHLAEVAKVTKKVAIAIRETYNCAGTSTRQHNEPAGNQDVWHLHVHVFPRHESDDLYLNTNEHRFVNEAERKPYADKLKAYFAKQTDQLVLT
ncbi:MAG TPA: HIT family protein [Candidatus Saccharimonadales bacterium]|nr:HIT family protein [Candidatus Saccharimonadales bacterium]